MITDGDRQQQHASNITYKILIKLTESEAVSDTLVNSIVYVNRKKECKNTTEKQQRKKREKKLEWHMAHSYTLPLTSIEYKIPLTTVSEYKIKMIRKNSTKASEQKSEGFKIHY